MRIAIHYGRGAVTDELWLVGLDTGFSVERNRNRACLLPDEMAEETADVDHTAHRTVPMVQRSG
jgi:hypothetical protein